MAGFISRKVLTEPAGSIKMFGGGAAPQGWFLCNGTAYSRTTYADLFAAIGTSFGSGDGSTTFNVPNFQGVAAKGAGSQSINGRSKNAGNVGQVLEDQMQGHWHSLIGRANDEGNGSGTNSTSTVPTQVTMTDRVQAPISDGTNGTPRIGTTTRDSSLAVHYIIKY